MRSHVAGSHSVRRGLAGGMVLALLSVPPGPIAGQAPAQGTVTGRIVQEGSLRPLGGVQVSLPGTGLGALANSDGRFLIPGVPAGEVTVRAQSLGYGTVDQVVTVTAGQTTVVDFQLSSQAIGLDEVVVTGTAGGTQRRAIGNVVTSLNADEVIARAPIQNVDQLIGQRTPGVRLSTQTGQVGTGAAIRIRGVASLTQGNDPIVYIDGVRMHSDPRDGLSQRGGANQSRLNDIHPSDIESIEIIKGPAAATLYGTEASNGVIQIITKRGSQGRPQFDVTSRIGLNWMQNPEGRSSDGRCFVTDRQDELPPGIPMSRFGNDQHLPGTYCFNVYENERVLHGRELYGNGLLQSYNFSLRGGTDLVRYFSSVSRVNDVGIVDWNWDRRTTVRLNLESLIGERLTVMVGGAYVNGQTRLSERSLQTSTFHNIVRSNPEQLFDSRRGWGQVPPEDMEKVEARNDIDRTTMSLELQYRPVTWSTHRIVGGLDQNSYDHWTLHPKLPEGSSHWYGPLALGNKEFNKGTRRLLTLDYSGSANLEVGDFSLQPSLGFQYYKTEHVSISASGQDFPAIPITTVTGGAIRQGGESFSENATVGVYVQQQVGWRNRAFVTAAVRADDNSAFGVEFDAAIYPKVSATWVMSEEGFWPLDFVDQFRVRGAWGAAGRQPDAFAASRLYEPAIGYNDQPALVPGAYGNAGLKPERGEELEVGFDASFLGGRLNLEVTRYQKQITDAILNRTLSPSTGFGGSQIVNVGGIETWGNEIGMSARVVETGRFAWGLDAQVSTNKSEIKDMGGIVSDINREGYPIASYFQRTVLSASIDDERNVVDALCDGGRGRNGLEPGGSPVPCEEAPELYQGPSSPVWDLGIGNSFTFFNRLTLYARVEGSGGHQQTQNISGGNHRDIFRTDNPMYWANARYGSTTRYDAGFLRLREVSASYDIPEGLVALMGARTGAVSLALRNLAMLWTAENGWSTPRDGSFRLPHRDIVFWDPENRGSGANPSTGFGQTVIPTTASAVMTVRFSF